MPDKHPLQDPEAFKEARHKLGLSAYRLAAILHVATARTIRRWETGDRDVPGPAAVALGMMLERHEQIPTQARTKG